MSSAFYEIARRVEAIKPGQAIAINGQVLMLATATREYKGAIFRPEDQVLENIVGSAYEFYFREDYRTGNIVFHRRLAPTRGRFRSYVSPDRRDQFHEDRLTGIFCARSEPPEIGPPIPRDWHLRPEGRAFLFGQYHETIR